jgi:hypothetical protein
VDLEHMERVEAELDAFAEKRARESKAQRDAEAMWTESVRKYHARCRQENREAWHAYHIEQADRIVATAPSLAADHRARAALLEEPGERGGGG